MKLSLDWLREVCDWEWSTEQLVEKLTMSGTEVESVHTTGVQAEQVVTAQVLSIAKHPNADRLRLCQVNDGKGTRQIVCGATNFSEGDIVPLALPGAELPGDFKIKVGKIRGETSEGMMCSGKELGLNDDQGGLMILPKDTPLGQPIQSVCPSATVLDVEITPNRADLLSYQGMARELSALGATLKAQAEVTFPSSNTASSWSVVVDSQDDCPRYTAQLIRGVKVAPSPVWLKQRLESLGLRAINNIVDITNYVLFHMGQPLHAFDAGLLKGKTIRVRRAQAGETFHALDEKTYTLEPQDLVIADGERAVALAGVMGGLSTGVTENTTEVLLESATFDPRLVRHTSRRLGLLSDSSYRFERGVDPAKVDVARKLAVQLILELAGGTLEELPAESTPYQFTPRVVSLRLERLRRIMRAEVSEQRVSEILTALGCQAVQGGWQIPSWRGDLEREIDLIEEVIRIEGLNRVECAIDFGASYATATDRTYARNLSLRQALVGMGFYEMMTTSLLSRTHAQGDAVVLKNPMTEDHVCLRRDLLSSTLPCVAHNLSREQRDLRLFEIGRAYRVQGDVCHEENRLILLMCGKERAESWTESAREADHYSLKGVVQALQALLPELKNITPVCLGAVESSVLKQYGIKVPVFAYEVCLPVLEGRPTPAVFQPLPQYPQVSRDLAFVVDHAVSAEQLEQAIRQAGIETLESVNCFDCFVDKDGSKLGNGKKSLAYSLTYRSKERTLLENEVSAWEQRIISLVKEKTGAQLRAS